jgi:uncharacterized Zn-binding protein involved in type VI secretion
MGGAYREGDLHSCSLFTWKPPFSHTGGPAQTGSPNVKVNSKPIMRGTDRATCEYGPVDFIVTGSANVYVNGKPAARKESCFMHGGRVDVASTNVLIGGPSEGVELGNWKAWEAACKAAAASRSPPQSQQRYENCGCESARQIEIAAGKSPPGEKDFLKRAIARGEAAPD